MKRNFITYLHDMLEAIEQVESFIQGMAYSDFFKDTKTSNAVIRSLEVMGESAKKVPDEIRNSYNNVPWNKISGMRDKLIHEYFGVDLQIVWMVCVEELPRLKPILKVIIQETQNNILYNPPI